MNKKAKIVGLVIIVGLIVISSIIFFGMKNKNNTAKNGLPMANLIEKKKDTISGLEGQINGKIQAIKEGELDISDENSPLKQMTKNNVGPIISLKINNQSTVFFVNKDGSQERKLLSDLRINDAVVVKYDNLTQKATKVYVLIDGVNPDQINFN